VLLCSVSVSVSVSVSAFVGARLARDGGLTADHSLPNVLGQIVGETPQTLAGVRQAIKNGDHISDRRSWIQA
jgi:hypothetical protein